MSRITSAAKKNKRATKRAAAASVNAAAFEYGSLGHIVGVLELLDTVYHNSSLAPDAFATGEPLDGLILTLLSQNTNDRNRDMAFERLRSACPTWDRVAAADVADIANLIRPAGLGDTKSIRMKAILERIRGDFGSYSLKTMEEWDAPRVREYLISLEGIGPKTVACVMAFDLNLPAFPVDTHVARISKRVGFAAENQTPAAIQDFLEGIVPDDLCRSGHLNMIEHGRKICGARKILCPQCAISQLCRFHRNAGQDLGTPSQTLQGDEVPLTPDCKSKD